MTLESDIKQVDMLRERHRYFAHDDLKTSSAKLDHHGNIHLVSNNTSSSKVKPPINCQNLHCTSSLWIFDKSNLGETKNDVGWQIAMNVTIAFRLQVTATPGFDSLYVLCYQKLWQFSAVPGHSEDDAVVDKHDAEDLYCCLLSMVHAIRTEDSQAAQNAVHWMIPIAMPWMMRRCSELTLANGKCDIYILYVNRNLFDHEWTDAEQAKFKILVQSFTSQSTAWAWRDNHCWLAGCLPLLGDTEVCINHSIQWTMNCHPILWLTLLLSHGWERDFWQCWPMNLRSFLNPTKMTHQVIHSSTNQPVMNMHSLGHFINKRRPFFICFLVRFVICRGG